MREKLTLGELKFLGRLRDTKAAGSHYVVEVSDEGNPEPSIASLIRRGYVRLSKLYAGLGVETGEVSAVLTEAGEFVLEHHPKLVEPPIL